MRVLIADDQRNFGTALADMVRYCGHDVVALVGSGLEAIHAFTLHKPDLVLMDYRMPKLNGATACRHILAKDPAARVVLLSAWSPLDGADDSGAMCFLPKPVELARLNATLLTISQSIPPPWGKPAHWEQTGDTSGGVIAPPTPAFEEKSTNVQPNTSATDSNTIVPLVPIPQEIISPIETFPVATFPPDPLILPTDVDQTLEPAVAGLPPAKKSKRRSSGRRRTSRARAC
jgi:CheY-like chemotaxis protein